MLDGDIGFCLAGVHDNARNLSSAPVSGGILGDKLKTILSIGDLVPGRVRAVPFDGGRNFPLPVLDSHGLIL